MPPKRGEHLKRSVLFILDRVRLKEQGAIETLGLDPGCGQLGLDLRIPRPCRRFITPIPIHRACTRRRDQPSQLCFGVPPRENQTNAPRP